MKKSEVLSYVYLFLAAIGLILPLSQYIPFLWENGLDFYLMLEQVQVNRISALFSIDLIITAVVIGIWFYVEGKRLMMKRLWGYYLCLFGVGICLALPLFLFFRQKYLP